MGRFWRVWGGWRMRGRGSGECVFEFIEFFCFLLLLFLGFIRLCEFGCGAVERKGVNEAREGVKKCVCVFVLRARGGE